MNAPRPLHTAPVTQLAPRQFRSNAPVHPGEILRRELDARGMTQADLAARTNLSAKHINQVLRGSALMSADVAITLERVLGTPASMWTQLEARWQEAQSRARAQKSLGAYTEWAHRFPLKDMIRRGLLPVGANGARLVEELLELFKVADPESFDRVWLSELQGGFRRAQQFDVDSYATATWLILAQRQVESTPLTPYSVVRLRAALTQLRALTQLPVAEGFTQARQILAGCGIALAFVDSINKSRISGMTWWLSPSRILIALSDRGKKLDIFWFNLFHELAHLLLHPKRTVFIEFERSKGDNIDGDETAADEFAAELLIPNRYDDEIKLASPQSIPAIAERLEIGESLVAGRWAHMTKEWRLVSALRPQLDVKSLQAAAGQLPQQ